MLQVLYKNVYYIAWAQALVATIGSLFFSEFIGLIPCLFCWYQRIFMYPLVFIIAVGILKKDKNLPFYVMPLSITGMFFAAYHYLLQKGIVPENVAPCGLGVPCNNIDLEWFGFITIPFLSLMAFAVITFCMWIKLKKADK